MKLGESLVRKGLIDERRLGEALKAQLIFGGHLGTCLIELGYLDEATLGQALAERHRVPYAPPERFDNIPRPVLQSLSRELIAKYQVIPLELHDTRLTVAMIHPRDLVAVDELSFASGFRIVPFVAPEVRIVQAMERYYEIPRKLRYVNTNLRGVPQHHGPPPPSRPSPANSGAARGPAVAVAAPPRPAAAQASNATPQTGLDAIAELLCRAPSPVALASAVLEEARLAAERCILFRVEEATAHYWRSHGLGPGANDDVPAVASRPFLDLVGPEPHYRGELPQSAEFQKFHAQLGIERAAEALLVPVRHGKRTVALYYADCGSSMGLDDRTLDSHLRLARLLSLGLGMIEIEVRVREACR